MKMGESGVGGAAGEGEANERMQWQLRASRAELEAGALK
jgi:hypothetical protein